jgi:hypothetical protein
LKAPQGGSATLLAERGETTIDGPFCFLQPLMAEIR